MKRSNANIRLPANADVWVLAGQSNMEGCGYISRIERDPNVYCFTTHHEWTIAKDPLHDLIGSTAPVDWQLRKSMTPPDIASQGDTSIREYWKGRNKGIGAGLGIAFGGLYARETGRPVGLIAAAHGGTSLAQWSHTKKSEGLNSLYGAMLERIKLASGSLTGILWYQGESDASPESSAVYRDRFIDWVQAVRADTGKPNLPVVTVQLGCVADAGRNPYGWEKIRDIQYAMPEHLSVIAVTSAIDLHLNDTIHIDAPGLTRLGKRMARCALKLTGERKDIPLGPKFSGMSPRINDRGLGETDITFSGVTGELLPQNAVHGFSVHTPDGTAHPRTRVCVAYRQENKRNIITVRTSVPLAAGDVISYGRGLLPVCDLTDAADMPVCAFSAAIEQRG
ncbi:MAG: sialate O-acetylesterase [Spirochaetota bacterium]